MKRINASSIEQKVNGTSRDLGKLLAAETTPGATIDFSGFKTVDNSFVDEFIWRFFERTSVEAVHSLTFQGETPLLQRLIKRAIQRRVFNVQLSTSPNPQIQWESIDFISELSYN